MSKVDSLKQAPLELTGATNSSICSQELHNIHRKLHPLDSSDPKQVTLKGFEIVLVHRRDLE